jgi:hypothetical protein
MNYHEAMKLLRYFGYVTHDVGANHPREFAREVAVRIAESGHSAGITTSQFIAGVWCEVRGRVPRASCHVCHGVTPFVSSGVEFKYCPECCPDEYDDRTNGPTYAKHRPIDWKRVEKTRQHCKETERE